MCQHRLRRHLLMTVEGPLTQCTICTVLIYQDHVTERRVFSFKTEDRKGQMIVQHKRVVPQEHAVLWPLTGQVWRV